MIGTPAFMPPEQALAKLDGMDGRTDVWAVGASMFTLLTGQLVHSGATSSLIVASAATQPARSLSAVHPGIDPRVAQVVDKALAFDPDGRWQSAVAMREAVRAARVERAGDARAREPLVSLFAVAPAPAPSAPAGTSGVAFDAAISATELDPAGASSINGRRASVPAPTDSKGGSGPVLLARAPSLAEKTAQPVSSDSRALPMSPSVSPAVWAVIGALVVAAGVTVFLTSGQHGSGVTAATTSALLPPPAPSVVAASVVSASALPPAPEPAPPTSAVTAAAPSAVAPALLVRPGARRQATSATPPTPAAASAPSPPRPSCDPPYTLDSEGKRRWKDGCVN